MLKKVVLFIAAVMLLASSVQAAVNQFVVGTTTPAIITGTVGQAGKISFDLVDGTAYGAGNSTKMELPNGVTLAQDYAYVIRSDYDSATNNVVLSGPLTGNYTADDVVIQVSGTKGSRILIMEVKKGFIKVDGIAKASIVLFDGSNATGLAPNVEMLRGSWNGTDAVSGTDANLQILAEENTLCIDVSSAYTDKYVSIALTTTNPYGYQPSTPNIAEIKPKSITPVALKAEKSTSLVSGQGAGCFVDYEAYNAWCGTATGWGTNQRGYVAVQNGNIYPEGQWTVTAEILVDGAVGAKGAYFQTSVQSVQFLQNQADLSASLVVTDTVATTTTPQYFLADGAVTTKLATTCTPAANEKVVKVVSKTAPNAVTVAMAAKKFVRFDIPSIVLVKSELPANAKVGVKITVSQGCGKFVEETFATLFTVVDACPTATATKTLLFPYFAGTGDGYWNGMALTNTGSAAVVATVTIVDANGGTGSIDVTVPAKGFYVRLVDAIVEESGFTGTVDTAARCYITVAPKTGSLTGFAMMGNNGESMGYTVGN